MNTLSPTFRLVVLGIVLIVVVVGCCTFPLPPVKDTNSCFKVGTASVEIGYRPEAKSKHNRTSGERTYVDWKDDGAAFARALEQVRRNNGQYCLCVIRKPGENPYKLEYPNRNCPSDSPCPEVNIRTVKVTKSKAADNIAAGESVANDPNVMHRVQSPYPGDIINVLSTLK
jgi:hypothetical protein